MPKGGKENNDNNTSGKGEFLFLNKKTTKLTQKLINSVNKQHKIINTNNSSSRIVHRRQKTYTFKYILFWVWLQFIFSVINTGVTENNAVKTREREEAKEEHLFVGRADCRVVSRIMWSWCYSCNTFVRRTTLRTEPKSRCNQTQLIWDSTNHFCATRRD